MAWEQPDQDPVPLALARQPAGEAHRVRGEGLGSRCAQREQAARRSRGDDGPTTLCFHSDAGHPGRNLACPTGMAFCGPQPPRGWPGGQGIVMAARQARRRKTGRPCAPRGQEESPTRERAVPSTHGLISSQPLNRLGERPFRGRKGQACGQPSRTRPVTAGLATPERGWPGALAGGPSC